MHPAKGVNFDITLDKAIQSDGHGTSDVITRDDFYDMISDFHKELHGIRFKDFEKLDSMNIQQVAEFYDDMFDSPESHEMKSQFDREDQAIADASLGYEASVPPEEKRPQKQGMGRRTESVVRVTRRQLREFIRESSARVVYEQRLRRAVRQTLIETNGRIDEFGFMKKIAAKMKDVVGDVKDAADAKVADIKKSIKGWNPTGKLELPKEVASLLSDAAGDKVSVKTDAFYDFKDPKEVKKHDLYKDPKSKEYDLEEHLWVPGVEEMDKAAAEAMAAWTKFASSDAYDAMVQTKDKKSKLI